MKIAIASDHAGYHTKQELIAYLRNAGHELNDFGTYSEESSDYPDYAHPMAESVENGIYEKGISLCGSGNGINMTVNKHQGIRSALCWNVEIAALARQHNDANICALPARFIGTEDAVAIVKTFLSEDFEGGRHTRRINKIPV